MYILSVWQNDNDKTITARAERLPCIGYDVLRFHSQRRRCCLTCKEISQIMPERARFSQRGRGKGQKLTRKFR